MISFCGSWLITNSLRPRKPTACERLGRGGAAAEGGDELERRLEEVGQKAHGTIDPKVRGKPSV
jgi:hypothetical protein